MHGTGNAIDPSWGHRLMGIEGLRALAATAVLIGHVYGKLGPAELQRPWSSLFGFTGHGLTLFFALSGFLLFRPFAASLLSGSKLPPIGRYAINRALRVFPAYVVIMLLVSLVFGVANTQSPTWGDQTFARTDRSVGYLTDPVALFANLLMIQTMFPATNRLGIGVAWSLSVELTFYVLLPLLAMLSGYLLRRKVARWVAVAIPPLMLFALGISGKVAAHVIMGMYPEEMRFSLEWGDNWVAVLNRSIIVHGDLFAYGMVAAIIVVLAQANAIDLMLTRRIVVGASVLGIVAAGAGFMGYGRLFNDSLVGFACGAALLVVVLPNRRGRHSLVARALEVAPLRYTGLVSYSFYLWHVPVIWFLLERGWVFSSTAQGLMANIALVSLVTLGLSSITYRFIEAPAMKLKKRTGPKLDRDRSHPSVSQNSAEASSA